MKAITQPTLRKIVRHSFYPVLVVGVMSAFMLLKDKFPGPLLPALSAVLSIFAIALIHLSERLFPYRPEWNNPQGDRVSNFIFTNVVLPGLSKIVEIGLTWIFLNTAASYLRQDLAPLWPHQWPVLTQLVLALVICEFFFYWTHRWGHRFETLWKFHSIHHAVRRVYWDNAGRFHPVDLLLNWIFYFAPLFMVGVSGEVIAAFLTLNAVTGLLEHANVDFDAGVLNRVFNTAQLHRWHHSVNVDESSNNFGKVLSIWDQLLGTYFNPPHREVGDVGVTTETIPEDVVGQMIHPFSMTK